MEEQTSNVTVKIGTSDLLDVREIDIEQTMSRLFTVSVVALCDNADIDFEGAIGQEASLTVHGRGGEGVRTWRGVCSELDQLRVEERGLSTYRLVIVPRLWLASQRRNYRIFQQMSELDIAVQLLGEWRVAFDKRVRGLYKARKYRVQYGESDYAFFARMLEEAGISFYFEEQGDETVCVLHDAPQANVPRERSIAFRDEPTVADKEHVTAVRVSRHLRPGTVTLCDHDYRRPADYKLAQSAAGGQPIEGPLESYAYSPGAFLFESDRGEATPSADDRGKHRTDEVEGERLVQKRLASERDDAGVISFGTNVIDLSPGVVMSMLDHPLRQVADGKQLLIVSSRIRGRREEKLRHDCEARSAERPYHPPIVTPKPKVNGVESATVVGPAGEEIHTDEFGRVRVHFHWDRESRMNEQSSCWIHVSQPWGGTGFGGTNLPRIGQEVIVDFLGGDPDRPMIIGRVYTNLQKTPYALPENKTQSGWKSSSSPATGGYNEIMFEDKAGQELVNMQAEKDLHKLVKNDEAMEIRHDRTKLVKHDEKSQVDNDRSRLVGHDESIQVDNDRTKRIKHDETVQIDNDRRKKIGRDETVVIGNDRTRVVMHDESCQVDNDRRRMVKHDEQVQIDNDRKKAIGRDEHVEVGNDRNKKVGRDESVDIGNDRNKRVANNETMSVGGSRVRSVGANEEVTIGASRIKAVAADEQESIGGSHTSAVEASKSTSVGQNLMLQVLGNVQQMFGMSATQFVGATNTLTVAGSSNKQVGLIDSTVVGVEKVEMISPMGEQSVPAGATARCMKEGLHESKTGGASIKIEGDTITIKAKTIEILADATVKIVGKPIDLNPA